VRYLVLQSVGPDSTNVVITDAANLGVSTKISGVMRPKLPVSRVQITMGQ
jgi:hypothetical protein